MSAAAEIFIICLTQRRRLENLSKFLVDSGGGSAARLTPLDIMNVLHIMGTLLRYILKKFSVVLLLIK